jgi:4-alpha-methyl-delta7-sterol-4alpha-methyl oxidase
MDEIWAAYADPRFVPLVVWGTAVSLVSFLAFAAPLTWLQWRAPAWAERWRVAARRPDVGKWLLPSIQRWLINNAALFVLLVVAWPWAAPWLGVRVGPLPGLAEVVLSCVVFAYADDLVFYAVHRVMHHGWLYRRVHSVHHRILTPIAFSGHYMHPVDFIVTALLMLAWPALAGAHVVTVYAWVVIRQLEAAEGHCGYHLPISPLLLLPGNHGADAHDFHHARFTGNYAGFFAWVDRVFGTWSKGYAEHAVSRKLRWVSWLPGTEVRGPPGGG